MCEIIKHNRRIVFLVFIILAYLRKTTDAKRDAKQSDRNNTHIWPTE